MKRDSSLAVLEQLRDSDLAIATCGFSDGVALTKKSRRRASTAAGRWVLGALGFLSMAANAAEGSDAALIDLREAVVVLPDGMTPPERKAATMLVEEVEKRSTVRWPVAGQMPRLARPAIVLGRRSDLARAARLLAETAQEDRANEQLRRAPDFGSLAAMDAAVTAVSVRPKEKSQT